MTRLRSLLALGAITAMATGPMACKGTTALHFVVCLDFDTAVQPLRTIRVKITNAAGLSLTGTSGQEITITAETQFPLRFSVVPSGSLSEEISVVVEAVYNDGRPAGMAGAANITARMNVHFIPGEIRTIPVLLQQSCGGASSMTGGGGVMCQPTQTCVNGQCVSATLSNEQYTAYSAAATCGGSTSDAAAADATVPTDGGASCAGPDNAVNITLPGQIDAINAIALGTGGSQGSVRMAALARSQGALRVFMATADWQGTSWRTSAMPASVMLSGNPISLTFTRSGFVAATTAGAWFSPNGSMLTQLTDAPAPTSPMVAGLYMGGAGGMPANEVQLCSFASTGLQCRVYTEPSVGLVSAVAPPMIPFTVNNHVLLSIENFDTPALAGAFRWANGVGRCNVLDMGGMPSCTNINLPPYASATASLTAAKALAIATVNGSGELFAAVLDATATMPNLVNIGRVVGSPALTTSSASSSEVLVAASEANRLSVFRLNGAVAATPAFFPTASIVGAPVTSLTRTVTLSGLGEAHIVAVASGNTVQLRAIAANTCR